MKRFFIVLFSFVLTFLISGTIICQVPEILNYQGYLTDNGGKKVPDGKYSITFNLYDNIFSSTPVWKETQDVDVKNGFLNVVLGLKSKFNASNIKFYKPLYLGIKIGEDPEIKPYTQLTAVPYSMVAKTLDYTNANDGDVLTFRDSTVKWAKIVTNSEPANTEVTSDKPALTLKQNGKGSVLSMSKSMEIKTTGKNSDIPQDRIEDLLETLTGYCAFKIAIYSKESIGILSEVNNEENTEDSFFGMHHGMGRGASFVLDNKQNTNYAIYINHLGIGNGIFCRQTGESGTSGWFFTENGKNSKSTVIGDNRGLGTAGYFINKNESNKESALVGITQGEGNAISGYVNNTNGHAGSFIIQNPNNGGASLSAYSSGSTSGSALYVKSTGDCRAASFESNDNAKQPTIFVSSLRQTGIYSKTKGPGLAGIFTDEEGARFVEDPVFQAQNVNGGIACDFLSTSATEYPTVRIQKNGPTSNIALQVFGSIDCNGNISKKGGSFVIDHPLDPENKLLCHSFVESPDMKNIYDGIVLLDDKGEATVILPDWFQALNKDFRYQLTCIGGWAQVFISEEIQDNKFKIAGGKPGMKISWQVTGIRHDKWAEENRIQVEKQKFPNGIVNETLAPPSIKPIYNNLDLQPTVDFKNALENHEQSSKESRSNLRKEDK